MFAFLNRDSSFFVCSIRESHSSPMDESACSVYIYTQTIKVVNVAIFFFLCVCFSLDDYEDECC